VFSMGIYQSLHPSHCTIRSSGLYGISHLQYLRTQITRRTIRQGNIMQVGDQSLDKGEMGSTVHGDTVRAECAGGGPVIKSAVEVLRPDVVELGVVLEGMDDTLALDGVRALHVVVVGNEQLLSAVERAPAALGLLRPVVPAHPHLNGPAPVRLHPLHPRHVRRVVTVRRPHKHAVAHFTHRATGPVKDQILAPADDGIDQEHGRGAYLGEPCWCP
jgi:hypothetical protein